MLSDADDALVRFFKQVFQTTFTVVVDLAIIWYLKKYSILATETVAKIELFLILFK